jgi:hypothetical protein
MPRFSNYGPLDNPLVDEGDRGFARMNARLRPDQLQPGEVAMSQNGRMGIEGMWQVRRGINQFGPIISTGSSALTVPWYLYDTLSVTNIVVGTNEVTFTVTGTFPFVDDTLVYVSGVSGVTPNPNGNQLITAVDITGATVTIALTGASGASPTGPATLGAPIISANTNNVYGACVFSDPATSNAEYIIMALNENAVYVKLSDGSSGTLAYPTGATVTGDVDMIQAFNKVFIFRDGATAFEWTGSLTGAFVAVDSGDYVQPLVLGTASNAAASGGVVTITNTHNLAAGDIVVIMEPSTSGLIEGDSYIVASVNSTTSFTFYADVGNFSGVSVVLGKRQSSGRGYSHMPCPPWAIYHQRRLWMPFNYTTTGTGPTITDRDIRDEIVASDIFDSDTYDVLQNQFKIASGGADYIVGLQAFAEDNVLVFCRNSLHLITGVSGQLEDTVVKEITREVGCVARRSIAQIGNQIFFLSDNGVYSVDFGDLYNLRGATLPLSEAVQPLINRINGTYANKAIGVYHDNRYWLFIPLDSSMVNNACLIYNVLNQGWESLDIVEEDGWNVIAALPAGASAINKLYTVNSFGGIHILDNREDDVDLLLLQPGGTPASYYIPSELTTRMFTAGTLDRKRFNSYDLHVESSASNASDGNIQFETENPDSSTTLSTISGQVGAVIPVAEDASVRGRIGNLRGYGGQMTITPTQGRPKIRSIKIVSQLTDLPVSSKS